MPTARKPPWPMRRTPRRLASKPPRRYSVPNTFPDAADNPQFAAAKNLVEQIIELTPDKEKLLTPGMELIKLPFPSLSIRQPFERFAFDDNGNWHYMPRRKFGELLHQVEAVIKQPIRASAIWLYGTMGYGKSHVLAALVCFLMKSGHRVLFLPDCRAWLDEPETYLLDAMKLTWADDLVTLRKIDRMKTLPEIIFFLQTIYRHQRVRVIFIVDQMNALQTDPADPEFMNKDELRNVLRKSSHNNLRVFSNSANNQSYIALNQKQSNLIRVTTFGGMTKEELSFWWQRNSHVDLGGHSREEIEYITGAVPLLLDGCIVEGRINLSSGVLRNVRNQVQQNSKAILDRRAISPVMWDDHCANMNACILGDALPGNGILLANDDHRYFFVEEVDSVSDGQTWAVGRYTCGAAREAMARFLTLHQMHTRNIDDYVKAIRIIDHSHASIGYIAEQGILVSIEQQGIPTISGLSHGMHRVMFPTAFPTIILDKHPLVLYIPYTTNYAAIDAVVVRVKEKAKTCALYPIQITVSPKHSNSESHFFSSWEEWEKLLPFPVSLIEFVWIGVKAKPRKEVKSDTIERNGKLTWHPNYWTRVVAIETVCPRLWGAIKEKLDVSSGR
ncbi:hypothetical protein BDD12DRAFT_895078 [Trichophaea hybrida]|nr:hypothetical protein BDD12DRAFT_895078 [Trichophaea hybrida]